MRDKNNKNTYNQIAPADTGYKNIRTDSYYHVSVVPENSHLVKICIPSLPLSLCRIQC